MPANKSQLPQTRHQKLDTSTSSVPTSRSTLSSAQRDPRYGRGGHGMAWLDGAANSRGASAAAHPSPPAAGCSIPRPPCPSLPSLPSATHICRAAHLPPFPPSAPPSSLRLAGCHRQARLPMLLLPSHACRQHHPACAGTLVASHATPSPLEGQGWASPDLRLPDRYA